MAAPAAHSHHHHHQKQTEVGGPHITHGVHAPTLIPKSTFDSEKHAQELRAAMKGLGTNDAMIIEAITTCTSLQRQEVITKYKVLFGRDLIEDLHHELGGHLKEVVLEVMASDAERDATALRKAMKGLGTDEETLVDILATRSNGEVANIKTAYEHLFKRDLEKDLRSETSGQLEHLLFALVQAARDENFEADEARAAKDAQTLIAAGEGKWITNESAFQQIMLTSSRAQIHALADEYAKASKLNLLAAVDKELSGNVKAGFHALVATAIDAPAYYADRLYHSMKGLGTSNDLLIRVIVSRAERDLEAIKAAFRAKYDQALEHMVQHEVSGDYRKILLALIGTTPAAPAK